MPSEYPDDPWYHKTRIMGLSASEVRVMLGFAVLTLYQRVLQKRVENRQFSLPPSHLMNSLKVIPFEFSDQIYSTETRMMGLSDSEDRVILAFVVLTQYQRVTDRRTDGRTDLP